MKDKTEATPETEPCLCRDLSAQISAILGSRSPEAREHFRNARIELLKAVRSLLDARIEHLSRPERRGTQVPVE